MSGGNACFRARESCAFPLLPPADGVLQRRSYLHRLGSADLTCHSCRRCRVCDGGRKAYLEGPGLARPPTHPGQASPVQGLAAGGLSARGEPETSGSRQRGSPLLDRSPVGGMRWFWRSDVAPQPPVSISRAGPVRGALIGRGGAIGSPLQEDVWPLSKLSGS